MLSKEKYETCPGYTIRIGLGGTSYRYFIVENGHISAMNIDPMTAPASEPIIPQDLWLINEKTREELTKYHDTIHKGCYFNVPYDLFVNWMQEHKAHHGGFLSFKENTGCHGILHNNCGNCNDCRGFMNE